MKKNLVVLLILLTMSPLSAFIGRKTFFGIRSQGLDGVRELVGWQQQLYQYDREENYGTASFALEYNRSFRKDKIAEFLFGSECIQFAGSRVIDRQDNAILADYFGLPADFSSSLQIEPIISNVVVDLNWFQALDRYINGLYFMFHIPIVHTKWDVNARELSIKSGSAFQPAGYMSRERSERTNLAPNVLQTLQGKTTFGDMQEPLQFGKLFGRQTESRVAEIQATIGWNFNKEWYHAGVNFRVGAPTGNKPQSEFIFEAIVGNRHHWDVGGGFSGHVDFWENEEGSKRVALYIDAHIGHLISSKQKRSFDLKNNGVGSRYILLTRIESPAQNLLINGNPAENQYLGRLIPAINKTTLKTKISIDVQADIVAKVTYQRNNFEFDIGYNFWGQSKEELKKRKCFESNKFALKGDAQLYGFDNNDMPIALNATQSKATIFKGQDQGNANFANTNADNQPAAASINGTDLNQLNAADSAALNIVQVQVNGSNPPILLQNTDIDENSALLPRAISHTLFTHFNYVWDNRDDIAPFLGLGLSSEWANTNVENNSGHSQWAVWFKGGLAY